MSFSCNNNGGEDSETLHLLQITTNKIPKDSFNLAYTIYFTLGATFLLPWNAFITAVAYKSLGLFSLVVPVMDVVYIKGRIGLYDGFYVTVAAVAISGVGSGLVQGGIVGAAGEDTSNILMSFLRIFTKAVYLQAVHGLRNSANLYFIVSIVVMIICIVFYNVVDKLPVIKYHNDLKIQVRSTLWDIVGRVKWCGVVGVMTYFVMLAIFLGCVTEDFHSQVLKDWYPILLITGYNIVVFPLFLGCLHGPELFRTEIRVTLLTCLLGLTNDNLISVSMILAPKTVQLQHKEIAGTVIVLFLFAGLAFGSIVAWFWDF
ncbi:hypothetical protein CsSME_00036959 [Camellia sinensis var. sinensis]